MIDSDVICFCSNIFRISRHIHFSCVAVEIEGNDVIFHWSLPCIIAIQECQVSICACRCRICFCSSGTILQFRRYSFCGFIGISICILYLINLSRIGRCRTIDNKCTCIFIRREDIGSTSSRINSSISGIKRTMYIDSRITRFGSFATNTRLCIQRSGIFNNFGIFRACIPFTFCIITPFICIINEEFSGAQDRLFRSDRFFANTWICLPITMITLILSP